MTDIIGGVTWTRLFAGGFMAGAWTDSHGRRVMAWVSGSRGDWCWRITRSLKAEAEQIAAGSAGRKHDAMREAIEIVRGYLRLARQEMPR